MTPELLRDVLASRARTEEALGHFIASALQKFSAEERESGFNQVVSHWLNTFYRDAVANVYEFAESPVETIFLNSLIFSFLVGDPLGLFLTAPHSDVLASLERHRELLFKMLEADATSSKKLGGQNGFLKQLERAIREKRITKDGAEKLKADYIANHVLGMWNAFYVTPQAGFPNLKIAGRSIRADLFVCIPAVPSMRFVVECDGYRYHSSESSFVLDRQRDRLLQSQDLVVRRYAGTEIWNDPVRTSMDLFQYMQEFQSRSHGRGV